MNQVEFVNNYINEAKLFETGIQEAYISNIIQNRSSNEILFRQVSVLAPTNFVPILDAIFSF